MSTQKNMQELQGISNAVELLDRTAKQLIKAMDDQIDAIVNSDIDMIDQVTENYANLLKQFKTNEECFIEELKNVHSTFSTEDSSIRLSMLIEEFPQYILEIEEWRELLSDNTQQLQRKQTQVLSLLEFGMSRNQKLISNIFAMLSNKNERYSSEGQKSGITTGMKINQEV